MNLFSDDFMSKAVDRHPKSKEADDTKETAKKSSKSSKNFSDSHGYLDIVNGITDTSQYILITKSGAFIKYSDVSENANEVVKILAKIESHFTLRCKQITGYDKVIKSYKLDKAKSRIIVPRFGIFEVLHLLPGKTPKSLLLPGDAINFSFKGKLNDNQNVIVTYLLDNFYNERVVRYGGAGLVLDLKAGQGKSYVAAYLIGRFKKRCAVILHTIGMVEQWAKVLASCYPGASIGYYYGTKKVFGDIMIIVYKSGMSDSFVFPDRTYTPLEFYNMFGFVIFDECHLYANGYCQTLFSIAQAPYMLGLSATPDENINKFDALTWWSVGPVVRAQDIPGYAEHNGNFTAQVYRINYYGNPDHLSDETITVKNQDGTLKKMTNVSSVTNSVSCDASRNVLIIQCIVKCLEKSLYVYVFADRREYLSLLQSMLREYLRDFSEGMSVIVTNDEEMVRIVGGATNEQLDYAESKSRVIFTTYQFGGTGRSIIKMNALVFATPRKTHMKQYVGRIFRLGSDNTIQRQIYDIVDSCTTLKNQWSSRHRYYKACEYPVEVVDYRWDDKALTQWKYVPKIIEVIAETNAESSGTSVEPSDLSDDSFLASFRLSLASLK